MTDLTIDHNRSLTDLLKLSKFSAKIRNMLRKLCASEYGLDVLKHFYTWPCWARPNQLPPNDSDWRYWLLLAGRGFGKTRTGAEWIRSLVESGQAKRIALIGPTAADVRDVMIEGESGIMRVFPQAMKPIYESSKRRLIWPNGAMAFAYSADEPNRLRGPQHDAMWADELASWRYPDSWDMALMGLRLGDNPRAVITTTPKPRQFLRDLIKDPKCHVTRGSTFDNQKHLPKAFLEGILQRYEGTALGAQEIHAELLDDMPGVMWKKSELDVQRLYDAPDSFDDIVVAIDPAVTSHSNSDETGIVVVARKEGKGYVLADVSGRYTPEEWALKAREVSKRYHAKRIVAEVNQGGDLIASVLKICAPELYLVKVRAIKGKAARAEPIAALYAQGKIHHVGKFEQLEDQMVSCDLTCQGYSPDRLDALVWGLTELFLTTKSSRPRISIIDDGEIIEVI